MAARTSRTMGPLAVSLACTSMFMLFVALFPAQVTADALTLDYCSSQNTGSDSDAKYWTWQSNGWCKTQCQSDYAYAIVQGNDCWCSNYTPEDQEDTSNCNQNCPGFPAEKCGSSDGKLFGYIAMGNSPSGTQNLPAATSAEVSSPAPTSEPATSQAADPTTTPVQTQDDPETVVQTVTGPAVVVTQTVSKAPASSAPASTTSADPSSSQAPRSSATPEPSTDIQIMTVSGSAFTKTVVYTPTAIASQTEHEDERKSTPTGAIVGGVVGGVAVVAAAIGGVFFLLWRRRRRQQEAEDDENGQSGINRNTSTMSRSGLMSRSEKGSRYAPTIATNVRNSRVMDTGSISPGSGSDRRHSRPYIFDQRLNPSAIMNFENPSRGSFVSMDDAHDYGRTLNVRNPDLD